LRRIPGTGASRHYRLAGDTPATSAGISACAGMGGRVLSHPQEEPLTTAGAAEFRARPGPAGSWGHERLIGWRCPRALPLGSVRAPRGLDLRQQQPHRAERREKMEIYCGIDWAEDVRHEVACGE